MLSGYNEDSGACRLAVIATPAKTVPAIVEECAKAGVDGVVILSAGFREIGAEGVKLEEEIRADTVEI